MTSTSKVPVIVALLTGNLAWAHNQHLREDLGDRPAQVFTSYSVGEFHKQFFAFRPAVIVVQPEILLAEDPHLCFKDESVNSVEALEELSQFVKDYKAFASWSALKVVGIHYEESEEPTLRRMGFDAIARGSVDLPKVVADFLGSG